MTCSSSTTWSSAGSSISRVDAERLIFGVDSPYFWFVADSASEVDWAHFNWSRDSPGNSQRLMELTEENDGDLKIGGALTTMHNFDLAETFWAVGDPAPGELVAVDPTNPDAVQLTAGAYDRGVVGVVSDRPAINLGDRSNDRRAPRLAELETENARLAARVVALEELVRGLLPAPRVAAERTTSGW